MVLFTVFKQFDTRSTVGTGYIGYSDFLNEVNNNRIKAPPSKKAPAGTEILAFHH